MIPYVRLDDLVGVMDELLEVVESTSADLTWAAYWSDEVDVVTDLRDHRDRLRRGDLSRLALLGALFNPAMPLQDMAMASGWHERYRRLATRFDHAVAD